jgi:hypothetical protein
MAIFRWLVLHPCMHELRVILVASTCVLMLAHVFTRQCTSLFLWTCFCLRVDMARAKRSPGPCNDSPVVQSCPIQLTHVKLLAFAALTQSSWLCTWMHNLDDPARGCWLPRLRKPSAFSWQIDAGDVLCTSEQLPTPTQRARLAFLFAEGQRCRVVYLEHLLIWSIC